MFVDGSNNVFMERSQYANDLNSIIIPNAQISVATTIIQIWDTRSYKLTLNFGSAPNERTTTYMLRLFGNNIRIWNTTVTELQTIIYTFTATQTGGFVAQLLGQVAFPFLGTTNAYNFYWSLVPLGII